MFDKIFGHKKITQQLKDAVEKKRVAHAYLFCGLDGIGKTETAKALTSEIFPAPGFPIWLTPETTQAIKIESLRDIKPKLYLKTSGEAKVVIIKPADQMTLACANALLKILEEPPQDTYFILITSKPGSLPATVRSRCQKIDFSPFSEAEMIQFLEKNGHSKNEAKAMAEWGEGSIGRALQWDLPVHTSLKENIQHILKAKNLPQTLQFCEEWAQNAEQIPFLLAILAKMWHEKILVESNREKRETLWQEWKNLLSAERALQSTANKQLLLEQLVLGLCR